MDVNIQVCTLHQARTTYGQHQFTQL